MKKKTGIMGGTFNPVHNGHLLLAETAREFFGLDKVIFMPSGNPYIKKNSIIPDGNLRVQMLEHAVKENPYFRLSRMEVEREGPTYTCDTLVKLRELNPEEEYYFIMGADSLLTLESWKNPEIIFQNCVIAAAVRGTGTEDKIKKIADYLTESYQSDIRIMPSRYIDISSSEIRKRIKDGRSVRYMIPDSVIAYIEKEGLYR